MVTEKNKTPSKKESICHLEKGSPVSKQSGLEIEEQNKKRSPKPNFFHKVKLEPMGQRIRIQTQERLVQASSIINESSKPQSYPKVRLHRRIPTLNNKNLHLFYKDVLILVK